MIGTLRRLARALLPARGYAFLRALRRLPWTTERLHRMEANLLRLHYPQLADEADARAAFRAREQKVFSQHGEDGLLLHIFSRIGVTDRRFVEFGVQDGRECNSANLAIHFGWSGLLLEGSERDAARAGAYYADRPETKDNQVRVAQAWVTAENIDPLLRENGMEGEIDFLSIDIDGNDYWVWKAIAVVRPRVVAIEYNASLGAERSLVVVYDPNFDRFRKHPSGLYHGASLAALTKLAGELGYALVGCESCGANAFFVRKELVGPLLPEMQPAEAWYPHRVLTERLGPDEQFAQVKDMEFVRV